MLRRPHQSQDVIDLVARQGGYLAELLGALSTEGRAQLHGMARMRVVRSRVVLAAQAEEATDLGFVLGGTLAMSKLLPDGRSHIVGLLVPTDMYGRVFQGPLRHRVESLSDARLLCVARRSFEDLLSREPAAERLLLMHALEELDVAREWVVILSGAKVLSRVASFLVVLARRKGQPTQPPGPMQVRLHLPRADLASYLGTRPETLSRALHELAARKVIRILDPYRFQIDDLPALLGISGQDLALPGVPGP
jgi:CRP/FNR family transcriptional regulator, anaerobic regulatory protein